MACTPKNEEPSQVVSKIKEQLKSYPDFPKEGILFYDIFSIIQKPEVFSTLRDVILSHCRCISPPIQCVAALEARGFLFGPMIALELKVPMVPIRKPGKLPGEILSVTYKLEYGEDTFEMQKGVINPGDKVLIVDDLMATGGSMKAACQLVEQAEGVIAECLCIMEIEALNGKCNLSAPFQSVIKV